MEAYHKSLNQADIPADLNEEGDSFSEPDPQLSSRMSDSDFKNTIYYPILANLDNKNIFVKNCYTNQRSDFRSIRTGYDVYTAVHCREGKILSYYQPNMGVNGDHTIVES